MEPFDSNELIKNHLEKMARWTRFLAFFGFFLIGLSILSLLIQLIKYASGVLFGILILYAIMLVPCLYLYYFSKNTSMAIFQNDTKKLEPAFENLARFFHFVSMFFLILIAISILQVIMVY